MKAVAHLPALRGLVTTAVATLPNRATVPVLAGLKLTVEGGRITAQSFDSETSFIGSVAIEDGTDGTCLVPGRLFRQVLNGLGDSHVDLTVDHNVLHVAAGRGKARLPLLDVGDYPALPALPEESGTVDAEQFAVAVGKVAVAASRELTLPTLTGVLVTSSEGTLTLTATDRYRAARARLPWDGPDARALIPAGVLTRTAKAASEAAGPLHLSLGTGEHGSGMVGLSWPHRQTSTRTIEGQHPAVLDKLFTQPLETLTRSVVVDAAELAQAVKAAAVFGAPPPKGRNLRISIAEDGVTVGSLGDDADGGMDLTVWCELQGEPFSWGMNSLYLTEALTTCGGKVTISVGDPKRLWHLTGKAADYEHALMPARLPG